MNNLVWKNASDLRGRGTDNGGGGDDELDDDDADLNNNVIFKFNVFCKNSIIVVVAKIRGKVFLLLRPMKQLLTFCKNRQRRQGLGRPEGRV